MERVIVIGCPGAGKSVFARKLRERYREGREIVILRSRRETDAYLDRRFPARGGNRSIGRMTRWNSTR